MISSLQMNLISRSQRFYVKSQSYVPEWTCTCGGNRTWNGATAHDDDDGILTAYDIASMDLGNTDLVVLSACDTALGDLHNQDGVFGLQRAFKIAGVKQLLMSLRKIPEKETAELMVLFYQNWLSDKTVRESLEPYPLAVVHYFVIKMFQLNIAKAIYTFSVPKFFKNFMKVC